MSTNQNDNVPSTSVASSKNTSDKSTLNFSENDMDACDSIELSSQAHKEDKESLLIEDTYDPGLIDDSVECKKDFNAVSFGILFDSIKHIPKERPPKTPMTLIEAFSKRIEYERSLLLAPDNHTRKEKMTVQTVDNFYSNKPKTNLNTALSNLFKAEALFGESKSVKGAQAFNEEPYELDLQYTEVPIVGGSSITVEALSGTTKPKMKKDK